MGQDAVKAYRALGILAAAPPQVLPLLRDTLRPAAALPAERLKKLIADLDDDDFGVREKATAELAKQGSAAESALRRALAGKPSAELRQRGEQLLRQARALVVLPDRLRQVRGLELLERLGTAEAKGLLKELTKGAAGAWMTEEATAALHRVER